MFFNIIIIIIKNENIRVTLCKNTTGALYIVNKMCVDGRRNVQRWNKLMIMSIVTRVEEECLQFLTKRLSNMHLTFFYYHTASSAISNSTDNKHIHVLPCTKSYRENNKTDQTQNLTTFIISVTKKPPLLAIHHNNLHFMAFLLP